MKVKTEGFSSSSWTGQGNDHCHYRDFIIKHLHHVGDLSINQPLMGVKRFITF